MKRENEIANMTWKILPEDLMCSRGRGQMGSRYSLVGGGGGGGLGARSVTSLDSLGGGGDGGLKKQVFVKTFMYKVRLNDFSCCLPHWKLSTNLISRGRWSRRSASTRTASRGTFPASCCSS